MPPIGNKKSAAESTELSSDDNTCPICSDTITIPKTTICNHTFCKACIDRWTAIRSDCPLCRTNLPLSPINPVNVTFHNPIYIPPTPSPDTHPTINIGRNGDLVDRRYIQITLPPINRAIELEPMPEPFNSHTIYASTAFGTGPSAPAFAIDLEQERIYNRVVNYTFGDIIPSGSLNMSRI